MYRSLTCLIALWGLLSACSGDSALDGGALADVGINLPDSGVHADAAEAIDAGETMDAGTETDATVEDTGVPEDTGVVEDSGVVVDAGVMDAEPADSGEAPDAQASDAEPVDVGSPDAGPMGDAGPDAGPMVDAGVDAGTPPDAGPDAGPMGDAGADAGTPPDAGPPVTCNPAFDAMDACGGNAVGTWTYVSACSDLIPFASQLAGCPSAQVTNITRASVGSVSLNGDGTFARMQATTQTGDLFLPTNCLPQGVTCPTLSIFIPTVVPGATGTCANATGGCTCAVVVNEGGNSSGTWSAQNGIITTIAGIDTRQYWYCVQGGSLEYRGLPNNPTDNEITYVLTP